MSALEKLSPLLFLLMWSSGAIFVKLGLEDASVWAFLAVRSVGAALALLTVCCLYLRHGGLLILKVPWHKIYQACAIGLVLQVCYQTTFFFSLDSGLAPGMLAIILGLQPLLTSVFARDKVGFIGYAVLLLGLAGLSLAVTGARDIGAITTLGVIFGLAAVIAITTGSIMQKSAGIHPVASAFYQSIAASIVFLALLPFTPVKLNVTPLFVLSAGWMILVVSTSAVLLLFYMLAKGAASKVGVLFYLVPVVTIVLDYLVFDTPISLMTMAGALIVLISVTTFNLLLQRDRRKQAPRA